jgi:hypothetical protein
MIPTTQDLRQIWLVAVRGKDRVTRAPAELRTSLERRAKAREENTQALNELAHMVKICTARLPGPHAAPTVVQTSQGLTMAIPPSEGSCVVCGGEVED